MRGAAPDVIAASGNASRCKLNLSSVDEIIFEGVVSKGIGRFAAQLVVPGRGVLSEPPLEWPERLHPGSLNVRIDKYPEALARHGLPNRIDVLDTSRFRPVFEI